MTGTVWSQVELARFRPRPGQVLVAVEELAHVAAMVTHWWGQRLGELPVRPSGLVYGRDVAVPMGLALRCGAGVAEVQPGDRVVMVQEVLGQQWLSVGGLEVRCQLVAERRLLAVERPEYGYRAPTGRVVCRPVERHDPVRHTLVEYKPGWWRLCWWEGTTQHRRTLTSRAAGVRLLEDKLDRDEVAYAQVVSCGPDVEPGVQVGSVVMHHCQAGYRWQDDGPWISLVATPGSYRVPMRDGRTAEQLHRSELLGVLDG